MVQSPYQACICFGCVVVVGGGGGLSLFVRVAAFLFDATFHSAMLLFRAFFDGVVFDPAKKGSDLIVVHWLKRWNLGFRKM